MTHTHPFEHGDPKLESFLDALWQELAAAADCLSRDWSLPVLATASDGAPAQRIVVLREVHPESRSLLAWTDLRSAKVAQLRKNMRVGWLFYQRTWRVQLCLTGPVTLHSDDALAESQWQKCRPESRLGYALPQAPGTVAERPGAISEEVLLKSPLSDVGRENFCVLSGVVDEIDLFLIRKPVNLRCRWKWSDGTFQGEWLHA